MINGFDFSITTNGELIIDNNTYDIKLSEQDDLRIQLAYNRIKSISNNWFIDNIGANLEELIGKPCTKDIAEYGKNKIVEQLTIDDLWDANDIFIKSEIRNNTNIVYSIYLKIYQKETEDTYSYEIEAEIDLIKGVYIKYGWNPRR
jgi:hypothetical protein